MTRLKALAVLVLLGLMSGACSSHRHGDDPAADPLDGYDALGPTEYRPTYPGADGTRPDAERDGEKPSEASPPPALFHKGGT